MNRVSPWLCRPSTLLPAAVGWLLCLGACLNLGGVILGAAEPGAPDEMLALLRERNVFDPNRRAGRREETRETIAAPAAESFVLTGVMLHDETALGFFDGSDTEYRRVLSVGEGIAGFTLVAITTAEVVLEENGKEVRLEVGGALRRVGDGDWTLTGERWSSQTSAAQTGPLDASSADPPGGGATATEDANEVLRRMMERRRAEDSQ